MSHGIGFLAAVGLGFLPGAWLGFTVPDRDIPWQVKLALSIVLSPAALAVEIVVLSLIGQPFSVAIYVVALLNLFALGVIAFDVRRVGVRTAEAGTPTGLLAPLWCFGLLIIPLLAMWLGIPNCRVYTWHNMMQMDACYQIVDLPAIPQEQDLAGVRLNYGWLGLVQFTSVSWLMDCPPTLVFPWLNGLQLLALVVLMYETARQFRAQHPIVIASTVAIVLLGTNAVGNVNALFKGPPFFRGEVRTGPFIAKYCGIDAMDIGLGLVAALVYAITLSTRRTVERIWLFVPILLLAIGLSYPLLLPSAVLVSCLWGVILTGTLRLSCPRYSRTTLWLLIFAAGTAVAITALYLRFLSDGRPMHALEFARGGELKTNIKRAFFGIGLMFALACPSILNAWRRRDTPTLLLAVSALLATTLYLATYMPDRVQYKNICVSELCLAPLVSVQLGTWFGGFGRMSIARAMTVAVIVQAIAAACLWFVHRPRELAWAIPINESSFYVRAAGGSDNAWLEAIRTETPRDTLLVLPDSRLPVSTLTGRASLVAAQAPGKTRVGHGVDTGVALMQIRGYPSALYHRLSELRQQCYSERADFARLTSVLQAFHRPVAVVFENPRASYLAWLQSSNVGISIGQDTNRIIRLLPPAATSP
jgi:hypothetical protein